MANELTELALRTKWAGKDTRLTDGGSRGAGRLIAMLRQNGATLYFQYFDAEAKKRFFPIGPHDSTGKRGLSLTAARDKAAELSKLYRTGTVDLHAHFAREREAVEKNHKDAKEAARLAKEAEGRSTLRELLTAYAGHLERAGKPSAKEARNLFKRFVMEGAPELADRRAAGIGTDDFVELIAKPVEAGNGRTAGKLRSYLRAAYGLALKSKFDPAAPITMRSFGITSNPIASIGALAQFNATRDRVLSAEELKAFLARLEAVNDRSTDAVMLALYLGGQRPRQLFRLKPVDVDLSAQTAMLFDSKGRRKQPRRHVLPLTEKPLEILRRFLDSRPADAPLVFGSLRAEAVSRFVSSVAAEMVKAKEARELFEWRDLRRTCETTLAALGVSSDVRAQIQSHGLGGVQQRHYDRHEYALEKRAALVKWESYLTALVAGETAEIIQFRGAVA